MQNSPLNSDKVCNKEIIHYRVGTDIGWLFITYSAIAMASK